MSIEDTVLGYVRSHVAFGQNIDLDGDLTSLVDSTAIMELVVWIETTFGFAVELDAITPANLGSVRRIAEFIAKSKPTK